MQNNNSSQEQGPKVEKNEYQVYVESQLKKIGFNPEQKSAFQITPYYKHLFGLSQGKCIL